MSNETGTILPSANSLLINLSTNNIHSGGESMVVTATVVGSTRFNNLVVSFTTPNESMVTGLPSTCTISGSSMHEYSCSVTVSSTFESGQVPITAYAAGYLPATLSLTVLPSYIFYMTGNTVNDNIYRCALTESGEFIGNSTLCQPAYNNAGQNLINMILSKNTAYISYYNAIMQCLITESGILTDCHSPSVFSTENIGIYLAFNDDASMLYSIANSGSSITTCNVVSGVVSSCGSYSIPATINALSLAINESDSMLYVISDNPFVMSQCGVIDGAITNCNSYTESDFNNVTNVAAATVNPVDNMLYVAGSSLESQNYNPGIWQCGLAESGNITGCSFYSDSTIQDLDASVSDVVINTVGNRLYATLSNTNTSWLASCVLARNGTISMCNYSPNNLGSSVGGLAFQ